MAKHNVLFETDTFIAECINRAGIAEVDIDGGVAITEGAVVDGNKELYTLSLAAEGASHVAIAYNPSVKYVSEEGKLFPARNLDDRAYTNNAGRVVDYFFPRVDVEFGITMAGVAGTTAPTKGKFLEPNGSGKFAVKNTATAGAASFEVIDIISEDYPTGDFTTDAEPVYVLKTRAN